MPSDKRRGKVATAMGLLRILQNYFASGGDVPFGKPIEIACMRCGVIFYPSLSFLSLPGLPHKLMSIA